MPASATIPNGLRESLVHSIFRQLHGALVECHSHNIVHRDFKIENIFVRSFTPGIRDKIDIALGDFGLAAQFADGEKLHNGWGLPSMQHQRCIYSNRILLNPTCGCLAW